MVEEGSELHVEVFRVVKRFRRMLMGLAASRTMPLVLLAADQLAALRAYGHPTECGNGVPRYLFARQMLKNPLRMELGEHTVNYCLFQRKKRATRRAAAYTPGV